MLAAYNEQLMTVLARHAVRGRSYCCPECRSELVLKRGQLITPHFAHRAESRCSYAHDGESEEHRTMKMWMYDTLAAQPWVRYVRVEEWLAGRRADVWVETMRGNRVAIECQASNLAPEALQAKLVHYRGRGLRVLYIVHAGVLRGWDPACGGVPAVHGQIQVVPAWLRALMQHYLDRFLGVWFAYVFDGNALWLCTFDPLDWSPQRIGARYRINVVGRIEQFHGLIELRDGLLIIQGTEALLPHKAA